MGKNEIYKQDRSKIKEQAIAIYKEITSKFQSQQGKGTNKIDSITYYKDLTLIQPQNGFGLAEQDVYVTKIIKPDGTVNLSIHNSNNQIANTDEMGNIIFGEEYRKQLEKINKKFALMIKNQGKEQLKLPTELSNEDELFMPSELEEKDETKEKIQDNHKSENKEIDTVAKAAGMSHDEVSSCSTIKPDQRVTDADTFADIAGIKGKYTKVYVINASSQTKNNSRFAFIGVTKDGKAEHIEQLKTRGTTETDKEIYSINRDGSTVKEKQTTEMFTTNDSDKMLSITKGQYGVLDVDYIRRDPKEDKFIGSPVETEHQRPTLTQVKEFMNSSRTTTSVLEDSVKKADDQIRDNDSKTTNLENIDNNPNNDSGYNIDEIIHMHDGTSTTLRAEAEKNGMSPEEYVSKIEKTKGSCTNDKILGVNQELAKQKSEESEENIRYEMEREERPTPAEMAEFRREEQTEKSNESDEE